MNKQYLIGGLITLVLGVVFTASFFNLQSTEPKNSMAEKMPVSEKIIHEPVTIVGADERESEAFVVEEIAAKVVADEVEEMIPPEAPDYVPHDLYEEPQVFWSVDEHEQGNDPEVYALKVDPKVIANLQVGQTFDFFVPELNQTFQTDINKTKNSFNGTHIFKGNITDGQFGENVSIVRGKNLTFVTVATLQGVYSASIDNATGKASVQSETSLNKNLHGDDGIVVNIPEIEPPNSDPLEVE